MSKQEQAIQVFETEVKIHINATLFQEGHITKPMFLFAQEKLLRLKYAIMMQEDEIREVFR